MPNKCGVVNCSGNYNKENKCRVFRLPKDTLERQKWLDILPPRENFVIDPDKFFICERHWPVDPPMIKLPGGSTRPATPPTVFNVPESCLPTPKPAPRPVKKTDQQLRYFLQKDTITSFDAFSPDRDLHKNYGNLIITRSDGRFVCVFMTENFQDCILSVVVENKPTLCSPLTLSAFKDGVSVPLGKILNPNNGLGSYSQFHEAVRLAINYRMPLDQHFASPEGPTEENPHPLPADPLPPKPKPCRPPPRKRTKGTACKGTSGQPAAGHQATSQQTSQEANAVGPSSWYSVLTGGVQIVRPHLKSADPRPEQLHVMNASKSLGSTSSGSLDLQPSVPACGPFPVMLIGPREKRLLSQICPMETRSSEDGVCQDSLQQNLSEDLAVPPVVVKEEPIEDCGDAPGFVEEVIIGTGQEDRALPLEVKMEPSEESSSMQCFPEQEVTQASQESAVVPVKVEMEVEDSAGSSHEEREVYHSPQEFAVSVKVKMEPVEEDGDAQCCEERDMHQTPQEFAVLPQEVKMEPDMGYSDTLIQVKIEPPDS